jgi:hypothetical protein
MNLPTHIQVPFLLDLSATHTEHRKELPVWLRELLQETNQALVAAVRGDPRLQLYVASGRFGEANCFSTYSTVQKQGGGCGVRLGSLRRTLLHAVDVQSARRGLVAMTQGAVKREWLGGLIALLDWKIAHGSDEVLEAVVKDNSAVLNTKVNEEMLLALLRLFDENGPHEPWLQFMTSITSCRGTGMPQLQEALLRVFYSSKNFLGVRKPECRFSRHKYAVETAFNFAAGREDWGFAAPKVFKPRAMADRLLNSPNAPEAARVRYGVGRGGQQPHSPNEKAQSPSKSSPTKGPLKKNKTAENVKPEGEDDGFVLRFVQPTQPGREAFQAGRLLEGTPTHSGWAPYTPVVGDPPPATRRSSNSSDCGMEQLTVHDLKAISKESLSCQDPRLCSCSSQSSSWPYTCQCTRRKLELGQVVLDSSNPKFNYLGKAQLLDGGFPPVRTPLAYSLTRSVADSLTHHPLGHAWVQSARAQHRRRAARQHQHEQQDQQPAADGHVPAGAGAALHPAAAHDGRGEEIAEAQPQPQPQAGDPAADVRRDQNPSFSDL